MRNENNEIYCILIDLVAVYIERYKFNNLVYIIVIIE
jgi:hypothetical protein